MARKRPTTLKRDREFQKKLRQRLKAEKAAVKRERRQNRDKPETLPSPGDGGDRGAGGDAPAQA